MKHMLLTAVAAACAAAPTYAQDTGALRLFQLPEPQMAPAPKRYGFDPALEADPRPVRKGARMLVGTEVGPGTLMGVGLFNAMPKYRGMGQERPDGEPRRSRKVGIGLLMKF